VRLDLNKELLGMDGCPFAGDCAGCQVAGGPVVCRCLGITEEVVVSAVTALGLRTVKDVRRHTGAGEGCNACHRKIQIYLDTYSSSSSLEICSAR
jgi:bacterioferritin-associated ferredoxin